MDQRHARMQLRGGRAALIVGSFALSAVCASGCALPMQSAAVPAAQVQGEERLMASLPPFEYVMPRDAIVRIVGAGNVTCTGTLIADDRVLTAHHCVSARDKKGRVIESDMAPENLQIQLGGDVLPWGEVKVRAIVAPHCGYVSGDGDIAILVLQRHLVGMPTYAARIEAPPEINDRVAIFGFGRCTFSTGGITRRNRPDTNIEALAPGHFVAEASICPGDSGGPVQSTSSRKDIVGVVSASVMDGDESTSGKSIFTRLDGWRQLFNAAEEISNGASPGELPPYGECPKPPPRKPWR